MSLIERAIDKLDAKFDGETVQQPGTSPQRAAASTLIEDAVARIQAEDDALELAQRMAPPAVSPSARPPETVQGKRLFSSDERIVARSKQVEINLARLHGMGMIVPDTGKTPLVEEFRVIKRPLINNAIGPKGTRVRNGNLIMVTSALPQEGKTFCAINLAISIAMEMDHTVLLVDADVARPSVPERLGIEFDRGLMDVLLDPSIDLADVMLRTNIETLSILPAGRPHRHATELLASDVMSDLAQQLSARYPDRIVIFDSPPLLMFTESRALAANMGQIVVVVAAESTSHDALKEALATIQSCEVVGMVLNKSKHPAVAESYGYYGY